MGKKYIVIGGQIISKNDGDIHYVSAPRLVELYGLNRSECILLEEKDRGKARGLDFSKYKVLSVRYDGDYEKQTTTKESLSQQREKGE